LRLTALSSFQQLIYDSQIEPFLIIQIVFPERVARFLEPPEIDEMDRIGMDVANLLLLTLRARPSVDVFGAILFFAALLFLRITDIKAEERLDVLNQFFSV